MLCENFPKEMHKAMGLCKSWCKPEFELRSAGQHSVYCQFHRSSATSTAKPTKFQIRKWELYRITKNYVVKKCRIML